ncbi:MAG TPA: hypothetical protein VHH88_10210 [Verrucomicrobiae bacterium]|nr:hypothetical protein [Verrucomicrobiae bacterium]
MDFGTQLYLPWRISHGAVLYRDVMYLTGGPLSQYFHALLFKVFGASLSVIIASNLSILACVIAALFWRFQACADSFTAAMVSAGVLMVLAFNQYSNIANYNFVTPYCNEVWHGLALSILAVCILSRSAAGRNVRLNLAAGFIAGLVFLTKPEVFAALGLAFLARFIFIWRFERLAVAAKSALLWLAPSLIAPCAFLIYFKRFETWGAAARSVANAWAPLLSSRVSRGPFYQWCLGLDAPLHHLWLMLVYTTGLAAVLAIFAFWFRKPCNTPVRRIVTVGLVGGLAALGSGFDWVDCGRVLPVLSLAVCVVGIWRGPARENDMLPMLWSVFAFALLAKLGFYTRVWHYGFALAMPALVAAIYFLLWSLPRLLENYGVRREPFRWAIGLLLLTAFLRLFVQSELVYRNKTVQIGSGADHFMAFDSKTNPAGPALESALEWLQNNTATNSTLAVLPEGVMLNYLSRRVNPARYLLWNPAELTVFGQAAMTADFERARPDYVVLVHRDASEYGAKYFGQSEKFGLGLMRWIGQNYHAVWLVGSEPLKDSRFGIKILQRNSEPAIESPGA